MGVEGEVGREDWEGLSPGIHEVCRGGVRVGEEGEGGWEKGWGRRVERIGRSDGVGKRGEWWRHLLHH